MLFRQMALQTQFVRVSNRTKMTSTNVFLGFTALLFPAFMLATLVRLSIVL
jgi:hypothetical protein